VGAFKTDIVTMNDLFVHMLRDAHCVEDKICKAQPEIIDRVCNRSLHEVLSYHLAQTHDHLVRIERAFERLGWLGGAASAECSPVDGLLERVGTLAAEVQAAAVRRPDREAAWRFLRTVARAKEKPRGEGAIPSPRGVSPALRPGAPAATRLCASWWLPPTGRNR